MTDLISVQEARSIILSAFSQLPSEPVGLMDAAGRVVANDVQASADLPRFDYSSMDGFALHISEKSSEPGAETYRVVGDIPAGSNPQMVLGPGQSARIMTGAILPEGADAIVPVENTDYPYRSPDATLPEKVTLTCIPSSGSFIRKRGSDLHAGQTILPAGKRLSPQDVGLLAALGMETVAVQRRPLVTLFSSGDELAIPGHPLSRGQIYDANSYSLAGLAVSEGARVNYLGIAADREEDVRAKFDAAVSAGADMILTSAGVSVGTYDFVRKVIEEHGSVALWRVNMRPGKPVVFGNYRGVPTLNLPGNPVSAFVGGLLFVIPALRKMTAVQDIQPKSLSGIIDQDIESDGRESYLRAIVRRTDGENLLVLTGNQASGNLYSLVQANALLIVPAGVKSLPAGSRVEFLPFSQYFK